MAMTGISATPHSLAISGSSVPRTVPGSFTSPKMCAGMPSFAINSRSQSRVKGLSSWLVEAMVYSVPFLPVRK